VPTSIFPGPAVPISDKRTRTLVLPIITKLHFLSDSLLQISAVDSKSRIEKQHLKELPPFNVKD
jgi:hypothetical protein